MIEKQDHLMNHQADVDDMDMVGIHMVEVGVWIQRMSITTR
jgi:hypothetical protein